MGVENEEELERMFKELEKERKKENNQPTSVPGTKILGEDIKHTHDQSGKDDLIHGK